LVVENTTQCANQLLTQMFFLHISPIDLAAGDMIGCYGWSLRTMMMMIWFATLIRRPALFIPCGHNGFRILPVWTGCLAEAQPCEKVEKQGI